MSRAGRLQGLGCLVVGGTSGIGLATARRFVEEGARVVVVGRSRASAEAAAAWLVDEGKSSGQRCEVFGLAADVNDEPRVEAIFGETLERLSGRLDVLFHVAGVSGRRFGDGPLHECSAEGWDVVLGTNTRGVFLTNRAAVRQMSKQSIDESGLRGTILNMGSVLSWSPSPDLFSTYAYAASKGAIQAMTICAAAKYAPERIRFNMIAPALIDTPMASRAINDPVIRDYLRTKQPIADGPGTVDDCAEAALYLCEPASRFVTGTILPVDGGWCISEGRRANG
ncbi:SDR family oxidoreductase [Isosphaeraceae bacterium EP7]